MESSISQTQLFGLPEIVLGRKAIGGHFRIGMAMLLMLAQNGSQWEKTEEARHRTTIISASDMALASLLLVLSAIAGRRAKAVMEWHMPGGEAVLSFHFLHISFAGVRIARSIVAILCAEAGADSNWSAPLTALGPCCWTLFFAMWTTLMAYWFKVTSSTLRTEESPRTPWATILWRLVAVNTLHASCQLSAVLFLFFYNGGVLMKDTKPPLFYIILYGPHCVFTVFLACVTAGVGWQTAVVNAAHRKQQIHIISADDSDRLPLTPLSTRAMHQITCVYFMCFACLLLEGVLLVGAIPDSFLSRIFFDSRRFSWSEWNWRYITLRVVGDFIAVYPPSFAFLIIMWRPAVADMTSSAEDIIKSFTTNTDSLTDVGLLDALIE